MWARRGTSCTLPVVRTPSVSRLVVCAFDVAMETFWPTSALSSVDCGQQRAPLRAGTSGRRRDSAGRRTLPTLGGPSSPTASDRSTSPAANGVLLLLPPPLPPLLLLLPHRCCDRAAKRWGAQQDCGAKGARATARQPHAAHLGGSRGIG